MACKRSAVRSRIPPPVRGATETAQAVSTSPSSRGLGHRPFTAITGVRIPVGTPSRKRYAEVAQLVRVSACHAEGRGFEPRLPRQTLKTPDFGLAFFFGSAETPSATKIPPGALNWCAFSIYVALRQIGRYDAFSSTKNTTHPLE